MLFGVSLELHLSVILIYLFFKVFAKEMLAWGQRVIYGLAFPLKSSHCSFCFFYTCVDFIICCRIL